MATMITISVKILRGREAQLQVTESEQVLSVKKLIAKEFDVPVERQRLVFKGKTLADSSKLCDYDIKHGTKVHLFVLETTGRKPNVASVTTAQSTLGLASTSAPGGDTSLSAHGSNTAAQPSSASTVSSDASQVAASLGISKHAVDSTSELTSSFKDTKLWTALDNVLQQHFRPDDVERIKQQFFMNLHHRIASLSLAELEEYAKTSFGL